MLPVLVTRRRGNRQQEVAFRWCEGVGESEENKGEGERENKGERKKGRGLLAQRSVSASVVLVGDVRHPGDRHLAVWTQATWSEHGAHTAHTARSTQHAAPRTQAPRSARRRSVGLGRDAL